MSSIRRWLSRILLGLLVLLVILFVVAAVWPIPADAAVSMDAHGAGSSSVEPSYSGLQREFPASNAPAGNPTTPEKVALGRLLFFDPVLSENNDLACASCHHPDYGFSSGQATATGAGGLSLNRNPPGLWNVAYAQTLFWDGREESLEAQTLVPLTHPDEMGVSDPAGLVSELAAIAEYEQLFQAAFANGLTLENMQNALAAFERSLISDDSPFDRYAAGNVNALTPQQRRGLTLFRSGATRCFECHAAPTFATNTFRVIGVPGDEDTGRAAVATDAPEGAFKVPSLRNVALSGPYMHNGLMTSLEEVVNFYANGGGRGISSQFMPNLDSFIQGFTLTPQERADLVAFLYALTDESRLPEIPVSVPSGLPVVTPQENPMRAVVAEANNSQTESDPAGGQPRTLTVQPGQTIQEVADQARPGDTIEVPYAVYHERVAIDTNDITLLGKTSPAGEWPILDGQGELSDGVIASGNNFEIGFFDIRNYNDNGVLVEGVTEVHFHDLRATNTGTYGVYPVQSTNVLIERVEVTGVDDAGVYAGQCENVIVRDSIAYGNVIGIELENTLNGEVYNNHTYDNTVGIFIVLLPNLTSKISSGTRIYDNLTENNNHANFSPPGATAGLLPPGVGILLLGSDNNEVYNNTVEGNKSSGVAVFSLTGTGAFEVDEIDVGPNPENNYLHDNQYDHNGYDPDQFVAELGIPTGDILWDGSGRDNRFDEPDAAGNFPPLLPGSRWPGFAKNAYWQALHFLIGLVS